VTTIPRCSTGSPSWKVSSVMGSPLGFREGVRRRCGSPYAVCRSAAR